MLGLAPASSLGFGLHFFGYDTVKITLLLVGTIFGVTVLRSFMTIDDRIQMGVEEVVSILHKIWPYLLIGIGLVVDEKVVVSGRVPTAVQVKELLAAAAS